MLGSRNTRIRMIRSIRFVYFLECDGDEKQKQDGDGACVVCRRN